MSFLESFINHTRLIYLEAGEKIQTILELFHHLEKIFSELEFMEEIIVYKNNDILKQESIEMSDFKILSNFCEISKKYENDKQKRNFFNYIFNKISDTLRVLISEIAFQVIIN